MMGVHHAGNDRQAMMDLKQWIKQEVFATVQNAAIGRAGLRVYGGGWIVIENGGLDVTGTANVSGSLNVTGTLNGSGTLDWTGMTRLRGPIMVTGNMTGSGDLLWSGGWELRGPGLISGNTRISGTLRVTGRTDVEGILNVDGTAFLRSRVYVDDDLFIREGKLEAGNLVIDRAGSNAGRIYSRGTYLQLGEDNTGAVLIASQLLQAKTMRWEDGQSRHHTFAGNVLVAGNMTVRGSKEFETHHPTKPDHWLRHGATESPVSGVEYWDEGVIGEDGETVVELPEYFEALTDLEGRTAMVSPIGRPHVVSADRIADGKFTVYGDPGREFSWLVKAARSAKHGGDFVTEEPVFGPRRKEMA